MIATISRNVKLSVQLPALHTKYLVYQDHVHREDYVGEQSLNAATTMGAAASTGGG